MSIKLHFSHSHLARFPKNLSDVSDEQGERFHQDISDMGVRYQERWDAFMLADYCWSIKRDDAEASHSRKSVKCRFMADDVQSLTFFKISSFIVNILEQFHEYAS